MTYTEIQSRNGKRYYYRVLSVREKDKVKKRRIYMGRDLTKKELYANELKADKKLKSFGLAGLEKIKPQIIEVLQKNDIKKAGIFGSYARGEERKNSDIDILVETNGNMSLFDLARLEIELEEKIGKKIQIVTYNSLHNLIKDKVFKEEKRII